MSFWKKIFSANKEETIVMINHLQSIYEAIMPEIHPQQYDYKENFFRTSIKFKTASQYNELQMQQLTRLPSVRLTKKTMRETTWKASYMEFISLYSQPALIFAQNDLRKMIEQIEEIKESYDEYESLLKYEETVYNIKNVLEASKQKFKIVEREVLEQSIHLLQQVIYAFEVEQHEKNAADKRALLEKLKFETDYMKK